MKNLLVAAALILAGQSASALTCSSLEEGFAVVTIEIGSVEQMNTSGNPEEGPVEGRRLLVEERNQQPKQFVAAGDLSDLMVLKGGDMIMGSIKLKQHPRASSMMLGDVKIQGVQEGTEFPVICNK